MSADHTSEPGDGRDPAGLDQPLLAPTRGPFTWRRRDRLRRHFDYNLWAVPVLFVAAGAALGALLPLLDRSTEINFGLPVAKVLERDGLIDRIGKSKIFTTVYAAAEDHIDDASDGPSTPTDA